MGFLHACTRASPTALFLHPTSTEVKFTLVEPWVQGAVFARHIRAPTPIRIILGGIDKTQNRIVQVERSGDIVRLSFSDFGPGILKAFVFCFC